MRLLGRIALEQFREKHADARSVVDAWSAEAESAEWRNTSDIKQRYAAASFLSNRRVIFNLGGDKYRIETQIDYEHQIVLIGRIGTHAEYSKWNL